MFEDLAIHYLNETSEVRKGIDVATSILLGRNMLEIVEEIARRLPYNGNDIAIGYTGYDGNDYVLRIAEGTGDNLLKEDEAEGYVDYFMLDVCNREEYDKDPENFDIYGNTVGGGQLMREKLIGEELYNKPIQKVIEEIFRCNGDIDAFELYSAELPDYTILRY